MGRRARNAPGPLLGVADVFVMLTLEFWESLTRNLFSRTRHTAFVALAALCHVPAGVQCLIKLSDWRPGGRPVVVVKRWGRTLPIPLTPEAIHVVERYICERERQRCPDGKSARWESEFLFVTEKGKPMKSGALTECLEPLKEGRSLHRSLLAFCSWHWKNACDAAAPEREGEVSAPERGGDHVDGSDDGRDDEGGDRDDGHGGGNRGGAHRPEDAMFVLRGYSKKRGQAIRLPKVPAPALRRLVTKANPLKNLRRALKSQTLARAYLRKHRPAIWLPPPERKLLPSRPEIEDIRRRKAAARGTAAHNRFKASVRRDHGKVLEDMLVRKEISAEQVGDLLGIGADAVLHFHRTHYRRRPEDPAVRPQVCPAPAEKPKKTAEERAVLRLLEGQRWPRKRAEVEDLSRRLAIAHLPVLGGLVDRRLIDVERIAGLLHMAKGEVQLLRTALAEGVPLSEVLVGHDHVRTTLAQQLRIREAAARRPEGDTRRAFYLRSIKDGFRGHRNTFYRVLDSIEGKGRMEEKDWELAAELASVGFPAGRDAAGKARGPLPIGRLAAVDAMVRAKKILPCDAAMLLGVAPHRFHYLSAALAAGLSPEQAARENLKVVVRDETWALVEAAHRETPGATNLDLYFRMRLACDFEGSLDQLTAFRCSLRGGPRRGLPAARSGAQAPV